MQQIEHAPRQVAAVRAGPAPSMSASALDPSVRRIVAAAIAEFGEKGYEATRVDDIGARAQTSKQLIYHYFGTKYALYAVAVEELARTEHWSLMTENFDALPPFCAIERYFELMLETKLSNNYMFAADQILHHSANFAAEKPVGKLGRRCVMLIESILVRGRGLGLFDPAVTAPQLLLHMVLLTTGFAGFRAIMPQYIGEDFSSPEAEKAWHRFALKSVLATLSAPCDAAEAGRATKA